MLVLRNLIEDDRSNGTKALSSLLAKEKLSGCFFSNPKKQQPGTKGTLIHI